MKSDPEPLDPAPAATPSVFDEIRRARAERSVAKAVALRVLGLAVIALAVWVISRNVTWSDKLLIESTSGTVTLDGEIAGDWRDATVSFEIAEARVSTETLVAAGLEAQLSAELAAAASPYASLTVTETSLLDASGSPLLQTASGSLEGVRRVTRIEARPGMLRVMGEIRVERLLPAIGFLILASLCVATRWWRLLALNGCPTRWYDAFRYTYSGLFFNTVVPGFNGGDVARAVAVVRNHPDRRADALMTVVVDRAVGLVAMILIGTAFVLSTDERLDAVKLPVALFCGAVLFGGALFCSGRVRRRLRFDQIVNRLPQGQRLLRLDAAAQALMRRPVDMAIALGFSFANHFFNGLAVMAAATALGSELGFADWMSTMAIANTLSAVPISPGGLGVGEVLYGSLARELGSTYAIGVATSLVYRLCLYVLSLLGGLVMLLPAGSTERPTSTQGADAA